MARSKRKQQIEVISKINHLCCQTSLNSAENNELRQLQARLDDLYTEKAKGAFIRSRAKWIEDGEKNSSYFFNLEKNRQSKKFINKLNINGTLTEDQSAINNHIYNYYSTLYSSNYSAQDADHFLSLLNEGVPVINEEFKALTEANITLEELDTAIAQMPTGKSPGPDGLTTEFYRHFWSDIRKLIFNALNDCIDKGTLSPTMKQGIITLIPKPDKESASLLRGFVYLLAA